MARQTPFPPQRLPASTPQLGSPQAPAELPASPSINQKVTFSTDRCVNPANPVHRMHVRCTSGVRGVTPDFP